MLISEMTSSPESPARAPRQEHFLERLTAAAACVVALITAGYGCYFSFVRAPHLCTMLRDFGAELPFATRIALALPWLPLLVALVALLSGILAFAFKERALLICAFIFTSLAVAMTVAAEVAAKWPMDQLLRLLST